MGIFIFHVNIAISEGGGSAYPLLEKNPTGSVNTFLCLKGMVEIVQNKNEVKEESKAPKIHHIPPPSEVQRVQLPCFRHAVSEGLI